MKTPPIRKLHRGDRAYRQWWLWAARIGPVARDVMQKLAASCTIVRVCGKIDFTQLDLRHFGLASSFAKMGNERGGTAAVDTPSTEPSLETVELIATILKARHDVAGRT
jgi:hypothetical protein